MNSKTAAPICAILLSIVFVDAAQREPDRAKLKGIDAGQTTPQLSTPFRVSNNAGEDEDPAIVMGHDGRMYVIWSSKRRNGEVHLYMKSSEDGTTWSAEERITSGPDEDYYPSFVQSKDGTFHVVWFRLERRRKEMDIWYSRSRDGRTWTSPEQVSHAPEPDWSPVIHEDSAGTLRVMWSSSRTGNRELFVARSNDAGKHWSDEEQITHSPEEDDFPHLIQTSGGDWLLAWTRYSKGSKLLSYASDTSSEIVIARSKDGSTWSPPEVCSPPDDGRRYVDFLPFLFEDRASAHLYLGWTSSRTGRYGDILLRDLASDPNQHVQLTTEDKSDYDGKIAPIGNTGRYVIVWVSTREGKTDIYARVVTL